MVEECHYPGSYMVLRALLAAAKEECLYSDRSLVYQTPGNSKHPIRGRILDFTKQELPSFFMPSYHRIHRNNQAYCCVISTPKRVPQEKDEGHETWQNKLKGCDHHRSSKSRLLSSVTVPNQLQNSSEPKNRLDGRHMHHQDALP